MPGQLGRNGEKGDSPVLNGVWSPHISTAQIIYLFTLNKQKTNFNNGPIEVGDVSPEITEQRLNKCHLKMSVR